MQSGCQGTEEGVSVADIIQLALLRRAEKQRKVPRKSARRKSARLHQGRSRENTSQPSSCDILGSDKCRTVFCSSTLAFSPDGSIIAAAYSNEIQLFDAQTQEKLGSPLKAHRHSR